jgi:hypothetical protein
MTEGNMGKCRFDRLIPVGDYKLNISVFKIQTPITIQDLPERAMTLKIGMGNAISISLHPEVEATAN